MIIPADEIQNGEVTLPVFDIKRYSINDGPGIRITLFFKGCPLHCVWCHNPESQSPGQTKLYTLNKCIACRSCIKACPQKALKAHRGAGISTDPAKCTLCGRCVQACPSEAMEFASKPCSIRELRREIDKEQPFFGEEGGITYCGGEPLMQKENLLMLLDACRGYHRAVDTTLFAAPEYVGEVAARCELFLVDLKLMDSDRHKFYTGVGNELILSNIRMLASSGCELIIRIPMIKGVNADEDNLRASAQFLRSLGITRTLSDGHAVCGPLVEMLPYHDIARNKHVRMGTVYNPQGLEMAAPSPEELAAAAALFAEYEIEARY